MLETARLWLRDLRASDAAALNEMERDPRVTRYVPFEPQTLEQSRAYIEKDLQLQAEVPRPSYDMAIVLRDKRSGSADGPLIGRCGMGLQRIEHREGMIWYLLNPSHWGQGYAVEAVRAMLEFAFGTLRLHRVWADCDPRNVASCRVAERAGLVLEGRLRDNYFLKGEWCSTSLYAMLESDWAP